MIIGITGNSGSGKTLISKILEKEFKANIVDADKVVKEMSMPGKIYFNEIVKKFGEDILLQTGEINKKKLANIIFTNKEKRELLNSLTFKYVVEEIKEQISIYKNKPLIIDAPLLIESNLNKLCDVVVSVIADESTKIKRICNRDNIGIEIAKKRLNAQPRDEFYLKNSNIVVINNDECSLEKIAENIKKIMKSKVINDEIVAIQDGKSSVLQFKKLLEYNNVLSHAFTLKPFDFGSNETYSEKREEIDKNYKTVCKMLNLDSKNIVRPYQTHTNNITNIEVETGIFPEELTNIDGLVTNKENKILSLTYADCTPIYLFDKVKKVIGNIHSGWQGTVKKIAKKSVEFMKEKYNCNPKDIICVIGPTIRKCHFEVQKDVRDLFYNEFNYMENIDNIIKYNEKTKSYYIDTVEINKKLLIEEGLLEKNIIDSKICTVCSNSLIHSYRQEGKEAGRNTALISLK